MNAEIRISGRSIGSGRPPYIVAEVSANHRQNLRRAEQIVEAAAAAGADAVKLQTYTADTLTLDSDRPCFRISGTAWSGRRLYDLYQEARTPWDWHPRLQEVARARGLDLFSTPFDPTAVAFLESLDIPAYKIASFEIVDLPLLRRVARTGRPIILSTGMATEAEIDEALATLRTAGSTEIALLKCTSAYPASAEEMNLVSIPYMAERFGLPVGLSDHSLEPAVPIASVALGAAIIEKHLTLDRADGGPDSEFSLEPSEFATMVQGVRTAAAALGRPTFGPTLQEQPNLRFRRSLFAVADIPAGARFTAQNVRSIRPADGLPPRHYDEVLGCRAAVDIACGTPLDWSLILR